MRKLLLCSIDIRQLTIGGNTRVDIGLKRLAKARLCGGRQQVDTQKSGAYGVSLINDLCATHVHSGECAGKRERD